MYSQSALSLKSRLIMIPLQPNGVCVSLRKDTHSKQTCPTHAVVPLDTIRTLRQIQASLFFPSYKLATFLTFQFFFNILALFHCFGRVIPFISLKSLSEQKPAWVRSQNTVHMRKRFVPKFCYHAFKPIEVLHITKHQKSEFLLQ